MNLLANAVRHGGGAAVTAEARVDAGTLIVRVADAGPGIPAEELPHIFDRFYKRRGLDRVGSWLDDRANARPRARWRDCGNERGWRGSTFTITIPAQR